MNWHDIHLKRIQEHDAVIILGLGDGQHIVPFLHRNDLPLITVIETDKNMVGQFAPEMLGRLADISIVCAEAPEDLFESRSVIEAIKSAPLILEYHPRTISEQRIFREMRVALSGRDPKWVSKHLSLYGWQDQNAGNSHQSMYSFLESLKSRTDMSPATRHALAVLQELVA